MALLDGVGGSCACCGFGGWVISVAALVNPYIRERQVTFPLYSHDHSCQGNFVGYFNPLYSLRHVDPISATLTGLQVIGHTHLFLLTHYLVLYSFTNLIT